MKQNSSLVALILLLTSCGAIAIGSYHIAKYIVGPAAVRQVPRDSTLPDPKLTPGVVRTTSRSELCDPSFHTATVRNVPDSVKQSVRASYGMATDHDRWCNTGSKCEIDHLIALILGGANDPLNLWPQAYEGPWNAHHKDQLEVRLHHMICEGKIEVAAAQKAIATNWIEAYKVYVSPTPTLPDHR